MFELNNPITSKNPRFSFTVIGLMISWGFFVLFRNVNFMIVLKFISI